ncbi:MAG: hypothetical protein IJO19_02530, partial [Clostridia bacterium]|nr:hypothetical protein [Clostridia bacterium]
VLGEAIFDGGIGINELREKLNDLEITDEESGDIATGEVVRLIIEELGYDGIIDGTVSQKFKNMGLNENTVHYIVFNPSQIKSAEPITYDDNGDVIPLSERFKEDNADIRYEVREDSKYSYDELTSKSDMQITQLGVVSDELLYKYKNDTRKFSKDMIIEARKTNNAKNTDRFTFLHNDDTDSNIMVSRTSFEHGAVRVDKQYIDVSRNLSKILKNAIAVNELTPRENSNGTKVFIGMAENTKNYVFVRMIVDNRSQKLDNYDILYSIKKSSIKKEEAGTMPAGLVNNNRSATSSIISISDLLEIVKQNKLVTSVLSKDVLENLEVERPDSVFADSLQFEQRDDIKEPKYVFANRILKQFSSNADGGTVAQMLDDIYKAIDDGKNADKQIKEVAKLIYDSTYTFDKSADEQRKGCFD